MNEITYNQENKEDENLIKWINDNDGFIHPNLFINIKNQGSGIFRGIYSKDKVNISKNDIITKIPYKLILSENTCDSIPNINKWEEIIKNNPIFKIKFKNKKFKIMLALLYESSKNESSFYYPYIKLLPRHNAFSNHPINIYYNDNKAFEILESISSNFINKISSISNDLLLCIKIILFCNDLFPLFNKKTYSENILIKMIQWAFFIQTTRSWDDGLIPFNDIFNHDNNSNISLKRITLNNTNDDKSFIFKADNQFKKNKTKYEIFDHYGYYNSMTLFMVYNFVPKAAVKYLFIPFKLNTKDKFERLKIEEIKKCDLNDNKILLCSDGPSKDLFTILRILSLTKNEYDLMSKNMNKNKYENVISHSNELKSVNYLFKLVLDLKKSTYTIDNLNRIHLLINNLKNKKLSSSDLIIKNVCLITLEEYSILEGSLIWINNILLNIINKSNISNK